MKKKCTHCKEMIPLSDFYPDKARSDGLQTVCKKCNNEMAKKSKKNRSQSKNDFNNLFISNT